MQEKQYMENSNYLVVDLRSMTEEAIDRGSIYIGTDGRRVIYEKVLIVQKAIEELQEEINNNPKKNIKEWRKIKQGSECSEPCPIYNVY